MNYYYLLGVISGAIVGGILLIVILKFTKTDRKIKCKYDERQNALRGKGFKLSFFTLLIYDAVYSILYITGGLGWIDASAGIIIGCVISIMVYVTFCIWNEAYFSLNENKKKVLIAFALIGIVNILLGIMNIKDGSAVTDGKLNVNSTNFFCGILFIYIFIVLLLKKIHSKSIMEEDS